MHGLAVAGLPVLLVYPWQEDRHQLYCTAPIMVTRYTSELPSPSNKEYLHAFGKREVRERVVAVGSTVWTRVLACVDQLD
jgi:hypothetical protein